MKVDMNRVLSAVFGSKQKDTANSEGIPWKRLFVGYGVIEGFAGCMVIQWMWFAEAYVGGDTVDFAVAILACLTLGPIVLGLCIVGGIVLLAPFNAVAIVLALVYAISLVVIKTTMNISFHLVVVLAVVTGVFPFICFVTSLYLIVCVNLRFPMWVGDMACSKQARKEYMPTRVHEILGNLLLSMACLSWLSVQLGFWLYKSRRRVRVPSDL